MLALPSRPHGRAAAADEAGFSAAGPASSGGAGDVGNRRHRSRGREGGDLDESPASQRARGLRSIFHERRYWTASGGASMHIGGSLPPGSSVARISFWWYFVSLSQTVSHLLRRGLSAPTPSQEKDGLVVFRLPAYSPPVTTEEIRIHGISGSAGWRNPTISVAVPVTGKDAFAPDAAAHQTTDRASSRKAIPT